MYVFAGRLPFYFLTYCVLSAALISFLIWSLSQQLKQLFSLIVSVQFKNSYIQFSIEVRMISITDKTGIFFSMIYNKIYYVSKCKPWAFFQIYQSGVQAFKLCRTALYNCIHFTAESRSVGAFHPLTAEILFIWSIWFKMSFLTCYFCTGKIDKLWRANWSLYNDMYISIYYFIHLIRLSSCDSIKCSIYMTNLNLCREYW